MAAKPFVPPRWFVKTAWKVHRGIARRGAGRGLWTTDDKRGWGALKLITTGRRSGREREAILGYLEDGDDFHALAMNGWGEGHPAWWTNLKAKPQARIMLADGSMHDVVAHRATGEEHERLWAHWMQIEPELEPLAARRTTPTDVVVLSPA